MFIFGSYEVLHQYLSVLSQSTYIQRSHFWGKTVIIKKGSLPQNSWWPCSISARGPGRLNFNMFSEGWLPLVSALPKNMAAYTEKIIIIP
jgi:hypothetical protein